MNCSALRWNLPEWIWTPVIYSPSVTMSLSSASVTETSLMFSNNLTLFVLCLKGKMQLFHLVVRLHNPGRKRKIFQGAGSGLLAVDDLWVLMATDGLVTAPQTLGALCAHSPFCKADGLVHSQEPGGYRGLDTKFPDSASSPFGVGARNSCQLSLHPCQWTQCLPSWAKAGLAGGGPRNGSCSGDSVLQIMRQNPFLVHWLSCTLSLGQSRQGGRRSVPSMLLARGEKEGWAALVRAVLLHPRGDTQLMRTLQHGSEWGLGGDTNTVLRNSWEMSYCFRSPYLPLRVTSWNFFFLKSLSSR